MRGVAVGDRVAIHHHAPCGECRRCRHGHETLCERFRATGLDPGGFAEYVRIEADLVGELLPLDGLDPVTATFTEPLACALRAQRPRRRCAPGDSLLVVGAGCSGLLHIAAAHALRRRGGVGARAATRSGWRAPSAGARPRTATSRSTWRSSARESPEAIAGAAEALAPGGALCLYAPPAPGERARRSTAGRVFLRELRVTASWSAGPADMRAALALLRRGADPSRRADHAPLPARGDRAPRWPRSASGRALKAVVMP